MTLPTEAERAERNARRIHQFAELEDPICAARHMAELCTLAADNAAQERVGVDEQNIIKVAKADWKLLKYALYELEDRMTALHSAYYDDAMAESGKG